MTAIATHVSCSRLGALLGQSKWGTRLGLYYELIGDAPPKDDNELFEEGRLFEDVIAQIACKKYGMRLVSGPRELVHGNIVGHPDRYVIDAEGKLAILEVKNTLFADTGEEFGWGQPGTDQVPADYLFQCQGYAHLLLRNVVKATHVIMEESGIGLSTDVSRVVYLAARLRGGVQLYRITYDADLMAKVEMEASHLLDCVARREPPDPQEPSEFRQRWLPVPEAEAEFEPAQLEWLRALRQQKDIIKAAEAESEKLVAMILGYMQDRSVGTYKGRKVVTAGCDREFDEAAFTVECPEVAALYQKLDRTRFGKEQRHLYERYLKHPDSAASAKRVLRLSKALDEVLK